MSEERITALEGQVTDLSTRLEIMDLEAEYARSWDAADSAGWAAVFTDDGVFEIPAVGISPATRFYRGTAELKDFCDKVSEVYRGLHFMHLPRLRIAGDVACNRMHFQWVGIRNATDRFQGQRHVSGYYDVTYRRVGGVWRMAHRVEKVIANMGDEAFDVYLTPGMPDPSAVSC